jgi:methyl-accepting chemotaxis protein
VNWFAYLKIRTKLIVLSMTAIVALCAITGFGLYQTRRVYDSAKYAAVNSVPSFVDLDAAQNAFDEMRRLTTQHVFTSDPADMKDIEEKIDQKGRELDAALENYEPLISDDKDKGLLAADRWVLPQVKSARESVLGLSRHGHKEEAAELAGTSLADLAGQVNAALAAHRAYKAQLGKAASDESNRIFGDAMLLEAVSSVAVLVVVLLLCAAVSHSITRPLGEAVRFARKVAQGDLTGRIEDYSRDEIGQLLRALGEMNDNLRSVVERVRAGSETIATATTQSAAGNKELSARTEEQASSLEETASSMVQLTEAVRQNADHAREANVLAANATDMAEASNETVQKMVRAIEQISGSSNEISEITGVIEGIAFQTNILALNAAVEAARAGEQGRGFAVVAGEVRSLAQRSAVAAREIKGLIASSVAMIRDGSKQATEVSATMVQVKQAIGQVSNIVGEIATATEEQSRGIEQVSQAVTRMDEVTQRNAALVEEAASAAQSLDEQTQSLYEAVAVFNVSGVDADALTASAAIETRHALTAPIMTFGAAI